MSSTATSIVDGFFEPDFLRQLVLDAIRQPGSEGYGVIKIFEVSMCGIYWYEAEDAHGNRFTIKEMSWGSVDKGIVDFGDLNNVLNDFGMSGPGLAGARSEGCCCGGSLLGTGGLVTGRGSAVPCSTPQ